MDVSFNERRADARPSPSSTAGFRRIDGRRLRSERTRLSIIDAFILLLRENPSHAPTAAQIAERAGYSVRSIFQRFPDLSALRVAAIDFAIERSAPPVPVRDNDADRAMRIREQVRRGRTCEQWLPLVARAQRQQGDSEELELRVRSARGGPDAARTDVPAGAVDTGGDRAPADPDRDRGNHRLRELGAHARVFGLSIEEACEVWIRAIDRLLPPTPAVS